MGTYLIPAARSVREASEHLPWAEGRVWTETPDGVLFEDPALDDTACAALYSDFVPRSADDLTHVTPLPPVIREAGRAARRLAYATDADLVAMSAGDTRVALRALARCVLYLNSRLDVP